MVNYPTCACGYENNSTDPGSCIEPDSLFLASAVVGNGNTEPGLLWIKYTVPKTKVLVFSSWNDVLDVFEHAFNANGITFIKMKGGRKSQVSISEEKRSITRSQKLQRQNREQTLIQVLLHLVQHGANNLNLLEVKHVILIETLLNPTVEAQAISRVHRIRQKSRTLTHRFIVK